MTTSTPRTACCVSCLALLDAAEADSLATALKAVANPVRLRLLHHIARAPGTTVCACHLPAILGVSQPTLSHHLNALVNAGLIEREQRGRWAHYRLNQDAMSRVLDALVGATKAA